jgi:F0F1-type ATP synthase assembly protein I
VCFFIEHEQQNESKLIPSTSFLLIPFSVFVLLIKNHISARFSKKRMKEKEQKATVPS